MQNLIEGLLKERRAINEVTADTELEDRFVELVEGLYSQRNVKNEPRAREIKGFHPSWLAVDQGDCARFWYYSFKNEPRTEKHDPRLLAIFANGHGFHERIQGLMEESGVLKENELPLLSEDPPLEGTTDGLVEFEGEDYMLELKSIATEGFFYRVHNKIAKKWHVLQLCLYMHMHGGVDKGLLLYEDKNTQMMKVFLVKLEDNQELVDALLEWLRELYDGYILADVLPTRGHRKNSKACKKCHFYEVCYDRDADDKGTDIGLQKLKKVVDS